ncbi:Poly(3-hydroxybutyrate) depolymerase [Frankia canadensis]|uniref:Poly(3-hydroxybutyrate) depolymerase n=1 Tax=Frankia canadensis TaxID=1836972 RepID=A0A2I2L230_9ACTN|nr:PHB depolymerase family esterase [Frankia canadensis]SNQ51983.1 Poly(3-hydroxybutyrate) depolymerase [Frankia canadensis]SOU59273.1 Poly(3-hydroxybutyrate) depolymerase [Frankia canadensis]
MSYGSPANRRRGTLRHRTRTTNTVWLPITAAAGVLLLLLWYAMSRDGGPARSSSAESAAGVPGGDRQRAAAAVTASPTPTVPPPPTSGCVTGRTLPTGISIRTLRVGGVDRTYALAVPAAGAPARPLPLILTFHDLNQTSDDLEAYTRLADQGTKAGFAVAAPLGAQGRWNFPRSSAVGPDDVLFTGLLLNELAGRMCLDAKRIFATGYADGGNMVLTVLCGLPGRFSAAVTVASSALPASCAAPSTNLLEIHGTADAIAPIGGGGPPRPAPFAGLVAQSATDRLARYASALGCSGAKQSARDTAAWERTIWSGCPDGRTVGLLAMQGGGHTWPGAQARPALGPTSDAFSATVIALTFFGYTPGASLQGGTVVPGPSVGPQTPGAPAAGATPSATAAPVQPTPTASAAPTEGDAPDGAGASGTPSASATPSPTSTNG